MAGGLSAEGDLPSFREHIRMLEVIRDRALAKGRENTALSAQHKIGKAMGYDSPRRARADRADRIVRDTSLLPRGEGARRADEGADFGGAPAAADDSCADGMPLIRRSAPPSPPGRREEKGWPDLDESGPEPAAEGSARDGIGSNWLELAGLGCPQNGHPPEKLIPISDLLEKPIFASERAWLAGREDASQRPFWLNGVSAAALQSGQICPPASPQPPAVS